MHPSETPQADELGPRIIHALRKRFSLHDDKANNVDIDLGLRAGVEMRGTNLWVLIFAIFVASIGLNVNSTAVIIGAMLISPLMGPIMGLGYGVGIYDFALIRNSLKNLAIATLIAFVTSAVYFAISPLTMAQSELLARTSPTIWDVLIALFGGLAGIVGATRKEKSTVIPGVAIATALMPPLCTSGFGAANGNWQFCLNALYLFAINSVFIAASSAIVVKAFRMPIKSFVDEKTARRVHRYFGAIVLLTVIPSLYLAYELVGEEVFRSRATQFVRNHIVSGQAHVVNFSIEPKARRIEVTLIGNTVPKSQLDEWALRLPREGLAGADLKVYQEGQQNIDVATLRSTLLGDLYKGSEVDLADKDRTISQLRAQINSLKDSQERFKPIPSELVTLYPQVDSVTLSEAPEWNVKTGWSSRQTVQISIRSSRRLSRTDLTRIEAWLRTRLGTENVRLFVDTGIT